MDEYTIDGVAALSAAPSVATKLCPQVPLLGPTGTELRGSLFIADESTAEGLKDGIHPARDDQRLARLGMENWKRVGEAELDGLAARGKRYGLGAVLAEGVAVEVELEGAGHVDS